MRAIGREVWLVLALALMACSEQANPEDESGADGGADASSDSGTTAPLDGTVGDVAADATIESDAEADSGSGDAGGDASLKDAATADGPTADSGCSGATGCLTGQACDVATGTCSTTCSPSQPCNGGCCDGTTCVPGTTQTACGASGICTNCAGLSTGAACLGSGACGCNDAGDCPCPAGWTCACGATNACADTPSTTDPIWAQWPMPNSPVDVEAGAPNPESYTDNGDGTVTDNVTGLMWQQTVSTSTFAWGAATTPGTAQNYCNTLATGGHVDWRLPTGIELVSIADFGTLNPSINPTYFPDTPGSFFWTSTPVAGSPSFAWYVDFADGDMNYVDVTFTYAVRCVR